MKPSPGALSTLIVISFLVLISSCLVVPSHTPVAVQPPPPPPPVAPPPSWAPAYAGQVHYYYLPDIEVYYDVWNHEYVYLDNGMWMFSPDLPPMYAGYDLYNGHVVVLDQRVYEPWRHHHLYLEHYPRYYYHSVYHPSPRYPDHPRGYNENQKQPIYAPRNVSPSNTTNSRPQGGSVTAPRSQPVEYRGHGVGQPVKVDNHVNGPRR